VACPKDGGEILEKRSKKGRTFYGCANWPNCDWVSFNRPLQEPCPQCGGLQVDMGRGRVRCLKHEGEPPRFAPKNGAERPAKTASGRTRATAARNGTVKARKATTAAKASRNGTAAKPAARKTPARRTVAKPA
jgi:ssDNA-binding Zn-finger/Zn-ribbon topoisomerase 1